MPINEIQKRLVEHGIDGWLLYDNHGSNRFARELLDLPKDLVVTRRFFYWIPASGFPVKLVHQIESDVLANYLGETLLYVSRVNLEEQLAKMIAGKRKIAMEYSPGGTNPSLSVVDAGTVELVRKIGPEVVSSDDLLQHFTSVLTEQQIGMHKAAAKVLEETITNVWELLSERLRQGKKITDYDVQRFILSEFTAKNCITEEGPTCSVNAASAMPHHMASKNQAMEINRGDFILVDLWCKQDLDRAVYADITRVAVAASEPTPKQHQIFQIVREAQQLALDLIKQRFASDQPLRGYEVDDVCRKHIAKEGYGEAFIHRTGHNIDTAIHGVGVNLDNLETCDQRKLLPGTCFSIEPGIYLPKEFGVRLEHDVVIHLNREIEVTGGTVEAITCLVD